MKHPLKFGENEMSVSKGLRLDMKGGPEMQKR